MLGKVRIRRKIWRGIGVSLEISKANWFFYLRRWRKVSLNWVRHSLKVNGCWRLVIAKTKSSRRDERISMNF